MYERVSVFTEAGSAGYSTEGGGATPAPGPNRMWLLAPGVLVLGRLMLTWNGRQADGAPLVDEAGATSTSTVEALGRALRLPGTHRMLFVGRTR